MKCVVTGGAGFIGSNLVDKLIKDNHEVIIFDDLSTGQIENINPKAKFHKVDISESYLVRTGWYKTVMWGADVVFHTAAKARVQPSIEDPISFNNVNITGTLNMLKASVDARVKRFVYSSSSSVYGNVEKLPTPENHNLNPMSPYALQKLMGEQYCKLFWELYGLETVCLRYFNVYGDRMNLYGAYKTVIPIFTSQILNSEPMTIRGDGEQRRDFTYVGDVVDANIKAGNMDLELEHEVFNIGNGDNRSVNEIADMIGGDKINVNSVIEPRETLADNKKAKDMLDWNPSKKIEKWVDKYKEDLDL
jgi:UDP-glucose 4-epimerase